MENSLVTYGFKKDREGIEHLKWISDLCSLHSLQVKNNNWKCTSQEFFERKVASNSKYVVCFKKYFAGKGAFINLSCFVMCQLNWMVFMAMVKHFRVKMRLASFCCVNLIRYTMTREFLFILCRKLDFHSQNYVQNLIFA